MAENEKSTTRIGRLGNDRLRGLASLNKAELGGDGAASFVEDMETSSECASVEVDSEDESPDDGSDGPSDQDSGDLDSEEEEPVDFECEVLKLLNDNRKRCSLKRGDPRRSFPASDLEDMLRRWADDSPGEKYGTYVTCCLDHRGDPTEFSPDKAANRDARLIGVLKAAVEKYEYKLFFAGLTIDAKEVDYGVHDDGTPIIEVSCWGDPQPLMDHHGLPFHFKGGFGLTKLFEDRYPKSNDLDASDPDKKSTEMIRVSPEHWVDVGCADFPSVTQTHYRTLVILCTPKAPSFGFIPANEFERAKFWLSRNPELLPTTERQEHISTIENWITKLYWPLYQYVDEGAEALELLHKLAIECCDAASWARAMRICQVHLDTDRLGPKILWDAYKAFGLEGVKQTLMEIVQANTESSDCFTRLDLLISYAQFLEPGRASDITWLQELQNTMSVPRKGPTTSGLSILVAEAAMRGCDFIESHYVLSLTCCAPLILVSQADSTPACLGRLR
ncbi:hypothetical protein HGRIS_013903 [Hohenbuehelia grisea]|uniref:Uncharacterized protein n=1 Tax=Hohenbuehelia grisea TaxID=104357 RepID=A0ABR3IX17_9AGAR